MTPYPANRFTDLFHRVVVVLDETLFPDQPLLEWRRGGDTSAADGLEFYVRGSTPCAATVLLYPDHSVPRVHVPRHLSALLGTDYCPASDVVRAAIGHLKQHALRAGKEGAAPPDGVPAGALSVSPALAYALCDGLPPSLRPTQGAAADWRGTTVSVPDVAAPSGDCAVQVHTGTQPPGRRPTDRRWAPHVRPPLLVSAAKLGEAVAGALVPSRPVAVEVEVPLSGDPAAGEVAVDVEVELAVADAGVPPGSLVPDGARPQLAALTSNPLLRHTLARALGDEARAARAAALEEASHGLQQRLLPARARLRRLRLLTTRPHAFLRRALESAEVAPDGSVLAVERSKVAVTAGGASAPAGVAPMPYSAVEACLTADGLADRERMRAIGMNSTYESTDMADETFARPLPRAGLAGDATRASMAGSAGHGGLVTAPRLYKRDGSVGEEEAPVELTGDWRDEAVAALLGSRAGSSGVRG